MKYLIFSDLHGNYISLKTVLEVFEKEGYGQMIFLGDMLYHGPRNDLPKDYNPKKCIADLNKYQDKIIWIKGNCDAEVDDMVLDFKAQENYTLNFNNKKYYFEHGHHLDFDNLNKYDADVILFGHIHIPLIEQKEGVVLANPGSVSIPKNGSKESYLSLDENGLVLKELF